MHSESTAGSSAKSYSEPAGRKAVEESLARARQEAAVEPTAVPHTFRVRRRVPPGASLSIVICSRTQRLAERCIRSIQATAGEVRCELIVVQHEQGGPDQAMRTALEALGAHVLPYAGEFNFALMNNAAAQAANSANLLFLNDDVYATAGGWCEAILAELMRPEIGVAGAVLRYPGGSIQHAGVVLGLGDGVGHAGRFQFGSELWPWLTLTREVSAVTGACLGMRAEVFRKLNGFDARFPNNYNDVDLCLRAGAQGLSVVCLSGDQLIHEECATRVGVTYLRERELFYALWGEKLSVPDPFYSRALGSAERIEFSGSQPPSPFV